jgi:UDP-N-acetylmuramoyl-L-alanyl-D-glutamate--2,6-diaminopimelate ligase
MEVSSHALAQSRVDGIDFDVAEFTNLSHDHLDFHHSMEAYWQAKASLFTPDRARRGVVNVDDPWGRRLLEVATIPLVPVRRDDADEIQLEPGHTSFVWRGQRVDTALTGSANVENALLAAESAIALGLDPSTVAAGLASAPVVPGRLQLIEPSGGAGGHHDPMVIVDYAHTPAALQMVLREAAGLTSDGGRVVVVFGCGGDRDRAKRPLMGAAADTLAAVTFLTSDNPRHEDPRTIIDEVRAGFAADAEDTGRLVVEPDRARAIERAVSEARAGDVVVVAGKGHETYQQIGDDRLPFDDRSAAAAALVARPGS